MKKILSQELAERGFIHQYTGDSVSEIVDDTKRTIYQGIDPSADSAHAGNMVLWILLRHLAEAGHTIIFLVGGGTGRIGDPKPDAERTLLDEETIEKNVAAIKEQAERLIGGGNKITFVDNYEWLGEQNFIEFLRDIGKHFTVNELIKKDAIATRLESDTGLSYTEFAYPLLQAFDYLELYRRFGCDVQVGGSDQWGNIVAGVDLVRRKEQAHVHALSVPLVVDKTTGKKFGKSEGNAIWLSAEKTSPYAFYQFWLNVSDEGVVEYLKLFTFISLEEISEIEAEWKENPGGRLAQKRLATAVTSFVHSEETAAAVASVSEIVFSGVITKQVSAAEKDLLLANAPVQTVSAGDELLEVLISSELASSKREARTFIESGAVSFAGEKITDLEYVLDSEKFTDGIALLRRGKKQMTVLVLG